jgi:hypothetical protein
VLAVVVLVIIVGGGALIWQQYLGAPAEGSLESLMAGMTIKGTSRRNGNHVGSYPNSGRKPRHLFAAAFDPTRTLAGARKGIHFEVQAYRFPANR